MIGAGVTPDVQLAAARGPARSASAAACAAARAWRPRAPGVFAAGDICEYESVVHGGAHVRIEHWDVAFNHGKTAALNMLGSDVAHTEVPYFFSVLADWGELEYVGPAYEWDEEIVRGSLDDGKFTNWYLKDGVVKAALTFGRSDDLDAARELIVAARCSTRRSARRWPTRARLNDWLRCQALHCARTCGAMPAQRRDRRAPPVAAAALARRRAARARAGRGYATSADGGSSVARRVGFVVQRSVVKGSRCESGADPPL